MLRFSHVSWILLIILINVRTKVFCFSIQSYRNVNLCSVDVVLNNVTEGGTFCYLTYDYQELDFLIAFPKWVYKNSFSSNDIHTSWLHTVSKQRDSKVKSYTQGILTTVWVSDSFDFLYSFPLKLQHWKCLYICVCIYTRMNRIWQHLICHRLYGLLLGKSKKMSRCGNVKYWCLLFLSFWVAQKATGSHGNRQETDTPLGMNVGGCK